MLSSFLLAGALGCVTLRGVLPTGPVLSEEELANWDAPQPASVTYSGEPRVSFPVLPLQVFGVFYDLDIVLVSTHPDWDMHEYARVLTPDGPLWMAKDADVQRVQSIVAGHPELSWRFAEVPVERFRRDLDVVDKSTPRRIDITLRYTNTHGDPVEVKYRGPQPRRPPSKRNGNTMGHSDQVVSVGLDLERFHAGGVAKIRIGGERVPLDRLLGIYRQRYALQQAQAGVAVTRFLLEDADGEIELTRFSALPDAEPSHSPIRTEQWRVAPDSLTYADGWSEIEYQFIEGGMARARVHQHGREVPVLELSFQPALPDMSRPFDGTATSAFRMDINGQAGHATGAVRAWWEDDIAWVSFEPSAPSWLQARPMSSQIQFLAPARVAVETQRAKHPD